VFPLQNPTLGVALMEGGVYQMTEFIKQKQPMEVFCKLTVLHLPGSSNWISCQELN